MIVSAVDYYIASIVDGHNDIIVDMIFNASMLLLLLLVRAQCLQPALSGLVQVHVIARQGDRAPVPPLYPADPHRSHHCIGMCIRTVQTDNEQDCVAAVWAHCRCCTICTAQCPFILLLSVSRICQQQQPCLQIGCYYDDYFKSKKKALQL